MRAAFVHTGTVLPEERRCEITGPLPAADTRASALNARRAALLCLQEATSTRQWVLALFRAPVVRVGAAIAAALAAALGTATWVGLDRLPTWGVLGNRPLAIGLWLGALMAGAWAVGVPLFPWRDARRRRRRVRELALAHVQLTIAGAEGVPIKGESAGGAFLLALLGAAADCIPRWSRWTALLEQPRPVFVSARIRDSAAIDGIEGEWSRKLPAVLPRSGRRLPDALVLGARGDRHFIAAEWQKYYGEAPLHFRRRGACEIAQHGGVTFALARDAIGWADACPPRHGSAGGVLFRLCLAALAAENGGAPDELVARIQALAQAYRAAYAENNPDLLAEFYQDFTADMRAALLDYFANADGLTVSMQDIDVRARDGRAVVSFTRLDEFRDRSSGLPQRMRARLTKVFVKTAVGWQIAAEEE